MKKLHQKETEGSRFLVKPVEDIEDVVGVTSILTPYYGLTLRQASIAHWKGREAPIKRLAKGLCHGLHHMHQCGFAHLRRSAGGCCLA